MTQHLALCPAVHRPRPGGVNLHVVHSMGEIRGSQLPGTEIFEIDIEFPDAPVPRLAKRDASLSTPATRLSCTLNCCTRFPFATSTPATTLMPLIPDEGVTPRVGAWSTWLQKTCAADTTLDRKSTRLNSSHLGL